MQLDNPVTALSRYLLPTSHAEATDYLTSRLETATLFFVCYKHLPLLFRQSFPEALLKDQERLLPPWQSGASGVEASWSEGELKCLELISEHLFPFSYEYVEMVAEEGEGRLPAIPLRTFGIDLWDGGVRDIELGWWMLARLNRDYAARDVSFPPGVLSALKKAHAYVREAWSWEIFQQTCALFEEPLTYLWIAIQVLDHDTENVFLDPTDEEIVEDTEWTLECYELLIREWEQAQALFAKAHQLVSWLSVQPQKRIRKVVEVWNLATWKMLMQ